MIRKIKNILLDTLYPECIIIVCSMVIMNIIIGCHESQERIDERQIIEIRQTADKPLAHALQQLDLKIHDLTRPEYYQSGYKMMCRMPVIDTVSVSPFSLHQWADGISDNFVTKENLSSHDVIKCIYFALTSSYVNQEAFDITPNDVGLANSYKKLCMAYKYDADQKYLKMIKNAGFSDYFDKELGKLLVAISEASLINKKAFSLLTTKEKKFLLSRPERFCFPNGVKFKFLTAPTHVQERIAAITRKINFNDLYYSAHIITQAVKKFNDSIIRLKRISPSTEFFQDGQESEGIVLNLPSPIGDVVILGEGENIIEGTAALLVDLGGKDTYIGGVADGSHSTGRLSLVIDVAGDDVYDNKKNRFSQGFGCLSIGMLVDLEGNDRYISGDMGQGSGMFGIGILEDLAGDDLYLMGLMGQGFGLFGTGILLDGKGNDRYMGNGLGQGAGSTMGFGCLVDLDGEDKYIADRKKKRGELIPDNLMNHVQGAGLSIRSPEWTRHFSFYGGIGFLYDNKGDDFYYSDGGNCMGSSYFMSVGVLVDNEGNDYYRPEKGYALGSAVHLTSSIFIDRKGDDQYFSQYHSGGVGSDQSIGIMLDYEGNDIYGPRYDDLKKKLEKNMFDKRLRISRVEIKDRINKEMADTSYGSALKPNAIGMLIDGKGDDQYFSREGGYGESCGGVIPPVDPGDWSHALLIDLNGNDDYNKRGMKNNHYLKYFGHALCYDTNYQGDNIFGNDDMYSLNTQQAVKKQINFELGDKISAILNPNFLTRYNSIREIVKERDSHIFDIIDVLKISGDNDLNRDLIEILNIFIIKKQFGKKHQKYMEHLLKAEDPFVRGFTAHTLGFYKADASMPALIRSSHDKRENVRLQTIWALGKIGGPDACDILVDVAITDPIVKIRRVAVKALANISSEIKEINAQNEEKIVDIFIKCASDEDHSIRSYAAFGCKNFVEKDGVRKKLEKLLKDKNVYVRRSAAKALIETGHKHAISVLIESLRYPSIDTFEFYGHDIIKEIAFYCGVDFQKEERYLYSTWANWWDQNGETVNLERNLSIMRKIENAFFVKQASQGIDIFERLLERNPDNIVVKSEFVRFCDEWINYKLLTQEKITAKIIKNCIRLQKIIVELEPDISEHRRKLAGFYAQLSNYAQAAEVMQAAVNLQPDNKSYREILNEYKKRTKK